MTINTQFDDLLNASYHQDGQKLLATNRYLQQRFDTPKAGSEFHQLSNSTEIKSIEKSASEGSNTQDIKL